MRDTVRQTRSHLVQLFEQQGLRPRHELGQNFLVDLNLLDLIVRHARLTSADVVLEVGAGTGSLTERLAQAAGHVVAVECDPHVFGHLQQVVGRLPQVTLLNVDALANKHTLAPQVLSAVQFALERVTQHEAEYSAASHTTEWSVPPEDAADNPWVLQRREVTLKLVANLPYHIATPVISNLVASALPWSRMVVTIQWELAERMRARPGTADYGALSVWLQSQARLKLIRKLPPTVFWPPPKVDSAVLVIERDAAAQAMIDDRAFFHDFLRDIFTQRRKRLLGVLAGFCTAAWSSRCRRGQNRPELEQVFDALHIPREARAEQLGVSTLVALANALTTVPISAMQPPAANPLRD